MGKRGESEIKHVRKEGKVVWCLGTEVMRR